MLSTTKAAAAGDLQALIRERKLGTPWAKETFAAGVRSGKTELIEYLINNNCPWK